MKKVIKTEAAYVFKLSKGIVQLIFTDKSKIILDYYDKKRVLYIDKFNKIETYDIHLVNRSENKKFLKRYEYYKKVFYEKMEERLLNKQIKKEKINNNNVSTNNFNIDNTFKTNVDLNKTL